MAKRGRPPKAATQPAGKSSARARVEPRTETYRHPEAESLLRPEVGTQPQFRKKKPPATYRYDSSLSPALEWDGQNPAREQGEALIRELTEAGLQAAELAGQPASPKRDKALTETKARISDVGRRLGKISGPFLNWAGKAERLSFDVPTLPLFVHERLSTRGIIETLKGHKRQTDLFDLFGDPKHSVTDQVLRAYEYKDQWVNRMVLGDSLVVMNSLLRYEGLGGQVQMIYMDPLYGVKFGSNFQPFVRKRDVKHNDDEDMTREPEMVKAYRDTWELGLHSYLTYMRDRLLLARELLTPSGSIFVQISDENLHHVRELMDEVFGAENFCGVITVKKTTGAGSPAIGTEVIPAVCDYLLWYARNRDSVKYRQLYLSRGGEGWVNYDYVKLPNGTHRRMTPDEGDDWSVLPKGSVVYRRDNLTSTAIVPDATQGEAPEVPRYETNRGPGSTAEVDFWTSRDVREALKSHLNYVAADTAKWEQSAAYAIDTHPRVDAFAKNAGLGFAIPYFHNGQPHDYIPDFIIRLKTEPAVHLILETKGFDPLEEVKTQAAQRWVAAVNAEGTHGTWSYAIARKPGEVRKILGA